VRRMGEGWAAEGGLTRVWAVLGSHAHWVLAPVDRRG